MTTFNPKSETFFPDLRERIKQDHTLNVIITNNDGSKRRTRLALSTYGDVMEMAQRSRTRGHYLSLTNMNEIVVVEKKEPDPYAEWSKSWNAVYNRLRLSGLNPNYCKMVETGLIVGYDKIKSAREQYWNFNLSQDERNDAVKAIDERLFEYIEILSVMYKPAKIVKMNFGRYNDQKLERIARCLREKIKCTESGRASYDVSFEYNPETGGACYSLEFRNCGNGHYYLALDATHAVFYEDD